MATKAFEDIVTKKLDEAGIGVNGNNPWDIAVTNPLFFERVAREGSIGLGDSYVDGWFDAPKLDETIQRILCSDLQRKGIPLGQLVRLLFASFVFNQQSKKRAKEVGEKHYDLGNDLLERMLDKRLVEPRGYWRKANNLDEAQEAKLDLICQKLSLQPGQRILDIGCGWGSFLLYAAEKYGIEGVGITISQEQKEYVQAKAKNFPVEVRYQDYRDVNETFDHVVSVGQFEHVGYKNYRTFFNKKFVNASIKMDSFFYIPSEATKPRTQVIHG